MIILKKPNVEHTLKYVTNSSSEMFVLKKDKEELNVGEYLTSLFSCYDLHRSIVEESTPPNDGYSMWYLDDVLENTLDVLKETLYELRERNINASETELFHIFNNNSKVKFIAKFLFNKESFRGYISSEGNIMPIELSSPIKMKLDDKTHYGLYLERLHDSGIEYNSVIYTPFGEQLLQRIKESSKDYIIINGDNTYFYDMIYLDDNRQTFETLEENGLALKHIAH